MADAVIDNPILNSPFEEPGRHFRFDDAGITSEVVDERRVSAYFMPIPAARKRSHDPTTGQVRSSSVDDVACWFIDTDYNEESFFVRDAYFTGAGDPYKSLKRALRADIDEEAWASLYRTRSRAFAAPQSGRIAVKVINHYGDEVMKTYEV